MRVEVVYATAEKQWLKELEVPMGATALDAIERSGIVDDVPGLEIVHERIGVFGKKVESDYRLAEGDRVEIYRPLNMSAAQARKLRAERRKDG